MITDVKAFQAEYETYIDAPREAVFDAMLDLNAWFPHRFKAGTEYVQENGLLGRGYEDWGDGQGALFSVTTFMRRPEAWVVFNMPGVFGNWMGISTLKFTEQDGGTVLRISAYGLGDVDERNEDMYVNGWPGVFAELKKYVEEKSA